MFFRKPKRYGLTQLHEYNKEHYHKAIMELLETLAPFAEFERSADYITSAEWIKARQVFDKWTRKIK